MVRSSKYAARLPNASATLVLIAVVATLLGVLTSAQSPQFKSHAAAVRVDALVTDGRRPVAGLTARDFELRDNGVIQTITDVDYETLPLNIISVLDVSSSVAGAAARTPEEGVPGRHRCARRGRSRGAHQLREPDRPPLRPHGRSGAAASARRSRSIRWRNVGHRRDLCRIGAARSRQGRTLVLLLSDGRDTSSWLTARKLVQAARRTDVVLYPVTIREARPLFTRSGRPTLAGAIRRPSERFARRARRGDGRTGRLRERRGSARQHLPRRPQRVPSAIRPELLAVRGVEHRLAHNRGEAPREVGRGAGAARILRASESRPLQHPEHDRDQDERHGRHARSRRRRSRCRPSGREAAPRRAICRP